MNLRAKAASMSQVTRSRATTMGLWAVIVYACLGTTFMLVRPAPAAPAVKIPEPTVGPEGVAELCVAAWLRGTGVPAADSSAAEPTSDSTCFPAKAPTAAAANVGRPTTFGAPPPAAPKGGRTVTLTAQAIAPGYTAVTVAAELGDPAVVHYYRVPIFRFTQTSGFNLYVATAVPAEVVAPTGARPPKLAVGQPGDIGKDQQPMAATVSGYLTALLTGDGDVSRFVAPGVTPRPVVPPPFASVVVTAMSSGPVPGSKTKAVEVLVEAAGTDAAGVIQPLAYSFTLAQRAGRWEITKTLPGPTLSPTQPNLNPTTTTTVVGHPTPTTSSIPATTTTGNIRRSNP